MRILITGAGGQLARAFVERGRGHDLVTLGRDDLDICDLAARDAVVDLAPDLVINTAAMTDVDGCELDPDAAYETNALGARNLALGCSILGAPLVQVSTDYVFSGSKGEAYWEFDAPDPISAYGASKLAGEQLVTRVHSAVYVVRAAWLYGLGGRNFVIRILRMADEGKPFSVVDNEVGSPTFCDDLADAVLALVKTGCYGTYHLAGEGACSRFEFATAVLEESGRDLDLISPTDHYERAARPPSYAPLRNFAAQCLGIRMPPWRDGLRRFFERGGGLVD